MNSGATLETSCWREEVITAVKILNTVEFPLLYGRSQLYPPLFIFGTLTPPGALKKFTSVKSHTVGTIK